MVNVILAPRLGLLSTKLKDSTLPMSIPNKRTLLPTVRPSGLRKYTTISLLPLARSLEVNSWKCVSLSTASALAVGVSKAMPPARILAIEPASMSMPCSPAFTFKPLCCQKRELLFTRC